MSADLLESLRLISSTTTDAGAREEAQRAIAAHKVARREEIYVAAHECANCGHAGINDEHPTDGMCESCDWRGAWPEDGTCPSCKNPSVSAICPKCDGGPYVCIAEDRICFGDPK